MQTIHYIRVLVVNEPGNILYEYMKEIKSTTWYRDSELILIAYELNVARTAPVELVSASDIDGAQATLVDKLKRPPFYC